MQNRVSLAAILPLFTTLAFVTAATAQSDIQCGKDGKTYTQPAGCAAQCKGQIDAERCMLQPKLKELDDGFYKSFYNLSIFFNGNAKKVMTCGDKNFDATLGTNTTVTLPGMLLPGLAGVMPAQLPGAPGRVAVRDKLVERIFGRWLHPYKYSDFVVNWTKEKNGEWADLESKPDSCGKYHLNISVQTLCRSPASVVVVIGHEMVHKEQYSRHYTTIAMDDFGELRADLHEVEAYSWELQQGNFKWAFESINKDPLFPGVTDEEKKESQQAQRCYEWDAESQLHKIITGWGGSTLVGKLDKFFNEDPWIKSQWLPKHADWKTLKLSPETSECKQFLAVEPTEKDTTPAPSDRPWENKGNPLTPGVTKNCDQP